MFRTPIILIALAFFLGGCVSSNNIPRVSGSLPAVASSSVGVWFDGDFGCTTDRTVGAYDADDCLAYLLLERSGQRIVGVSTVAGNVPEANAYHAARELVGTRPLYRGNLSTCDSPAVMGMAEAARAGPIKIVAAGPLTNVALFVTCHPELKTRIEEVVFVGGRRPEERFVFTQLMPVDLDDLNSETDIEAVHTVLESGVQLTLVPFEAGKRAPISYANFEIWGVAIPESINSGVRAWDRFSRFALKAHGMPLWDVHAVAYLLFPNQFDCAGKGASVEDGRLIVRNGSGVKYCLPNNPDQLRALELSVLAQGR